LRILTLLVLIAIVLVILSVPLFYRANGSHAKLVYARISWLFIRLIYQGDGQGFIVKIGPWRLPQRSLEKKIRKRDAKSLKRTGKFGLDEVKLFLSEVDVKSIIPLGIILLRRLWTRIRPRRLQVHGLIGFDNPMHTGQFMGLYEAVSSYLGLRREIDLRGDFYKCNLELDWKCRGRFTSLSIVVPTLRFAMQEPAMKAIMYFLGRK